MGGHADVAEGSIMMAVHPQRVRMDRLQKGLPGPLSPETTQELFEKGMKAVSPNGILGDPHGMNAALGRLLIEALAERIVRKLHEEANAREEGNEAGTGEAEAAQEGDGGGEAAGTDHHD